MRISRCRLCKGTRLERILDLGIHPPSDAFLRKEQLDCEEKKYPLDVYFCLDCSLMQLGFIVPPAEMFNNEYVYVTSISKTASNHFKSFAQDVMRRFGERGSFVVEMGSNDGTLLSHFRDCGASVLGVDPSRAATMAMRDSIKTINDFFCEETARRIEAEYGRAQVIAGANVFAHVHDLDDVMLGIDRLLAADGIVALEFPYVLDLIKHLAFDTIYHEHVSYLGVSSLIPYFRSYDLEIFDVVRSPVHGGSLRLYVKRIGSSRESTGKAVELHQLEAEEGLHDLEIYRRFEKRVEGFREEFTGLLRGLRRDGGRIAGNGAPAKGNTLLNYCAVGPETIEFIAELNPLKHFTFTPGMHIPVLPHHSIQERKPDYQLILPWNLRDDIIRQESVFRSAGGRFIVPLPESKIV